MCILVCSRGLWSDRRTALLISRPSRAWASRVTGPLSSQYPLERERERERGEKETGEKETGEKERERERERAEHATSNWCCNKT